MARFSKAAQSILASQPPLPLEADQWRAVVKAMGISEQQAEVAKLVLRDLSNKQIEIVTTLSEGTVKDYLKRIGRRTKTRGRMQFAMHVLALALRTNGEGAPRSKR